ERDGRRGGGQPGRVVVVLENDRDAVQRPAYPPGLSLGVQRRGVLPGGRVEPDNGVERRRLVVVGRDPGEVRVDEPDRRRAPGPERRLEISNARLVDRVALGDEPAGKEEEREGPHRAD